MKWTAQQIAADIVSAFAVHNSSLGNARLEAAPCDELRSDIAKAIEIEREACAQIAEAWGTGSTQQTRASAARDIALLIRNRSKI